MLWGGGFGGFLWLFLLFGGVLWFVLGAVLLLFGYWFAWVWFVWGWGVFLCSGLVVGWFFVCLRARVIAKALKLSFHMYKS